MELAAGTLFQITNKMLEFFMLFARSRSLVGKLMLVTTLVLVAPLLSAQPESAEETIRAKLLQARPDFQVSSVRPSVALSR